MKMKFDQVCAKFLNETQMQSTTTNQPSATNAAQQQYQNTPTPAPTSNNNQEQGNEELMKALQLKMQDGKFDEKFKQQLLQMLQNPNQQTP